MALLNQILDFINEHLMPLSVTVAGIVEFVGRMLPTQKPFSILWLLHDFMGAISKILASVVVFMDKVLPQKLAEVPAPEAPKDAPKLP